MPTAAKVLYPVDSFLRFVAVLAISSAIGVGLVAGRVYMSGALTFVFLIWNLFLAWIPVISSLALIWFDRAKLTKTAWLIAFPFWLVFFPNTFYLVTDLMHLGQRLHVPIWYDTLLLFSFAWNGVMIACFSLVMIQVWLRMRFTIWQTWLVMIGLLVVSSFGVYLGRYLRWNSWDVVTQPAFIAEELIYRTLFPYRYPRMVGFTAFYAGFFFFAYIQVWMLFNLPAQSFPSKSIKIVKKRKYATSASK